MKRSLIRVSTISPRSFGAMFGVALVMTACNEKSGGGDASASGSATVNTVSTQYIEQQRLDAIAARKDAAGQKREDNAMNLQLTALREEAETTREGMRAKSSADNMFEQNKARVDEEKARQKGQTNQVIMQQVGSVLSTVGPAAIRSRDASKQREADMLDRGEERNARKEESKDHNATTIATAMIAKNGDAAINQFQANRPDFEDNINEYNNALNAKRLVRQLREAEKKLATAPTTAEGLDGGRVINPRFEEAQKLVNEKTRELENLRAKSPLADRLVGDIEKKIPDVAGTPGKEAYEEKNGDFVLSEPMSSLMNTAKSNAEYSEQQINIGNKLRTGYGSKVPRTRDIAKGVVSQTSGSKPVEASPAGGGPAGGEEDKSSDAWKDQTYCIVKTDECDDRDIDAVNNLYAEIHQYNINYENQSDWQDFETATKAKIKAIKDKWEKSDVLHNDSTASPKMNRTINYLEQALRERGRDKDGLSKLPASFSTFAQAKFKVDQSAKRVASGAINGLSSTGVNPTGSSGGTQVASAAKTGYPSTPGGSPSWGEQGEATTFLGPVTGKW